MSETDPVAQIDRVKLSITRFYDLINIKEFRQCYEMLDISKRKTITLKDYTNLCREFMEQFERLEILKMSLVFSKNKKNELYNGRDFISGITELKSKNGKVFTIKEIWAMNKKSKWTSYSTNFVWVD